MNRGLTTDEAERGVRPLIQTKDEWNLMWLGSLEAERDAHNRHAHAYARLRGKYGNA